MYLLSVFIFFSLGLTVHGSNSVDIKSVSFNGNRDIQPHVNELETYNINFKETWSDQHKKLENKMIEADSDLPLCAVRRWVKTLDQKDAVDYQRKLVGEVIKAYRGHIPSSVKDIVKQMKQCSAQTDMCVPAAAEEMFLAWIDALMDELRDARTTSSLPQQRPILIERFTRLIVTTDDEDVQDWEDFTSASQGKEPSGAEYYFVKTLRRVLEESEIDKSEVETFLSSLTNDRADTLVQMNTAWRTLGLSEGYHLSRKVWIRRRQNLRDLMKDKCGFAGLEALIEKWISRKRGDQWEMDFETAKKYLKHVEDACKDFRDFLCDLTAADAKEASIVIRGHAQSEQLEGALKGVNGGKPILSIYTEWEEQNKEHLAAWRGDSAVLRKMERIYASYPVPRKDIAQVIPLLDLDSRGERPQTPTRPGEYDMRVIMGKVDGASTWGDILANLRVAGSLMQRGLRVLGFLFVEDPSWGEDYDTVVQYMNELVGVEGQDELLRDEGQLRQYMHEWRKWENEDGEGMFELVYPKFNDVLLFLSSVKRPLQIVLREDLKQDHLENAMIEMGKRRGRNPYPDDATGQEVKDPSWYQKHYSYEAEARRVEEYVRLGWVDHEEPMVVLTRCGALPFFLANANVFTVNLTSGDLYVPKRGPQPHDMEVYMQFNDPAVDEDATESAGVVGDQRPLTQQNADNIGRIQDAVDRMRGGKRCGEHVVLVAASVLGGGAKRMKNMIQLNLKSRKIGFVVVGKGVEDQYGETENCLRYFDQYVNFSQLFPALGVDLIIQSSGMGSSWEAMRSGKLSVGFKLSHGAKDKVPNATRLRRVYSSGVLACWMTRDALTDTPTVCPEVTDHPSFASWRQMRVDDPDQLLRIVTNEDLKANAVKVGRQAGVELTRTRTRMSEFFLMVQQLWREKGFKKDSGEDFTSGGAREKKVKEIDELGRAFLRHLRRVVLALDGALRPGGAMAAPIGWVKFNEWLGEAQNWMSLERDMMDIAVPKLRQLIRQEMRIAEAEEKAWMKHQSPRH